MIRLALIGCSIAVAFLAAYTLAPRGEISLVQNHTGWRSKLASTSYLSLLSAPGESLINLYLSGTTSLESVLDLREYNAIDAVWFYVNGSDVRHVLSHAFYRSKPVGYHIPLDLKFPGDEGLIQQESSLSTDQSANLLQSTGTSSISNRFRDNGELLYSLRSARKHMRKSLRTQYLVTTDFWPGGLPVQAAEGDVEPAVLSTDATYTDGLSYWSENEGESEDKPGESLRSNIFRIGNGLLRYGQVPQWLNLSSASVTSPNACQTETKTDLVLCHDWQLAESPIKMRKEYNSGKTDDLHDILRWKLAALPTFNSMSAEAVLSLKMDNLSEAFVYSNDDMFFARDMAASDFYTPLFGPVLRMSTRELIEEDEHPEEVIGEGPSILWSNWLLSKRFGLKKRPWFYHFQKTYTKLAILESRLMWADSFEAAVMNRFRGDGRMANSHFLTFHYIIERHREALLWAFFILKWESGAGSEYTKEDLLAIQRALGSTDEHQRPVSVKMPVRKSLDMINDELVKTHILKPKSTEYLFTSMDGSANTQLPFRNPDKPWPSFEEGEGSQREACVLDIGSCWPIGSRDPDQVFKHFAFARPECGDCAIVHLVGQSGTLGLKAFLPEGGGRVEDSSDRTSLSAFHLPLVDDWRQCDFSLRSVLRGNNMALGEGGTMPSKLDIAVSLLHRYAYVIGESHSFYASLQSNEGVSETVDKLKEMSKRGATPAMICLNDDLGEAGEVWDRDNVTGQLGRYFESIYPDPLPFERRALAEDEEEDPDDV